MVYSFVHFESYQTFLQQFFLSNKMHFMRKLFALPKDQTPPQIQLELISKTGTQVYQQQISTALFSSQTHNSGSSFQSSNKNNIIESKLNTKFLEFCQLIEQSMSSHPNFGVLIGVLGQQKFNQNHLPFYNIVKFGQSQEINSLQALRKRSLDSFVVFLGKESCQFDLKQMILAEQRLILVVQSWKALQNLVLNLQTIILQLFEEKPLEQCISYLCFSIYSSNERYYIELKHSSYFLQNFRKSLKKINISFYDENQLLHFVKSIKLKDYLNFRQSEPTVIQKLLDLREQIEKHKRIQFQRLDSMLSTCGNQNDKQLEINSACENNSIQDDIQAQYFKKRVSQKRDTQTNEDQNQSPELFYPIEQRDESYSSGDQDDLCSRRSLKNKVKVHVRKHYCRSEYEIDPEKQEDLDEQFFTKQ